MFRTAVMFRRTVAAALGVLLLTAQLVLAVPPQPAPPYPPSPPPPYSAVPATAPVYRGPVRAVDPTPPPLSPAMRAVYAPFYVAGLVFRYGFYYLFVAPFEVFGRTATYGVDGGVPRREPEGDGA